jgi:hypothetical protein
LFGNINSFAATQQQKSAGAMLGMGKGLVKNWLAFILERGSAEISRAAGWPPLVFKVG